MSPDILMAGIADFCLGSTFLHLAGFVDDMTTDTGHIVSFVRTGMPVQQVGITLMAFKANSILCFQG